MKNSTYDKKFKEKKTDKVGLRQRTVSIFKLAVLMRGS